MGNALESGAIVGGFRIVSLIGEGAMGTVYLAENEHGERVALKRLALELARDERFRQRFLRESQVAASLHHPSIVPVVSYGEDGGLLYLAMAYIDGPDLRDLLRGEGPLEPERAVRLVENVADALDAAHAVGLVHRDVKPGNILVASTQEGEGALICDFGLARHVSSVSSLTGERGFVGTIDYVPPEQIEGGSIDGRTDVYSLGCVLYEAITGSRPFERDSELSVVFAHLNEPPPRATELRPELPQIFNEVFRTALAKAPSDRYANCGELANAARAALEGKVGRRRDMKRRRLLAAAGTLIGAAAIAAAAVLATKSTPASHRPPQITQHAIRGVTLGHPEAYYKTIKPPGYKPSILGGTNYPELSFQGPELAVYFPAPRKPAHIITTWNRDYRTAEGIGPCSTLAEMNKVYGLRVQPSWGGTSPDGKVHWSWTLGRNLLFITADHKTISSVVLFKGVQNENHRGSPQANASYVGSLETPCK